jgi:glycosyltransferase involved in cell wall biosynthesis
LINRGIRRIQPMKKILIIDSEKDMSQPLAGLFSDLGSDEFSLTWLASGFSSPGAKPKMLFLGPEPASWWLAAIFIFLLPGLWLGYFLKIYSCRREGISEMICIGVREKIIFTPLARLWGIKTIWLELPGQDARRLLRLRRIFSGPSILAVFTLADAERLAGAGFKPENISNISLGVNRQSIEQQDNIFFNLAKADKPYSFYKNFTLGAVAENSDHRRLEVLLQAVKASTNLIPNLRLVVIGQDTFSGNLSWLVKRLGLERRVWLVGEQKRLLQWFDDLDLYLILAENPKLADLERALLAASRGVPLLGFPDQDISQIIIDGQTGFVSESGSAEMLAQKIIMVESDETVRKKIGENGRYSVIHNFDRQQQLSRLREILS